MSRATLTNGETGLSFRGKLNDNFAELFDHIVATIDDLRAMPIRSTTGPTRTLGYYESGDGGGATYQWNSASTADDDGGRVIEPDAGGTGRWEMVIKGSISIRQYGAKGDGTTNDASRINAAIEGVLGWGNPEVATRVPVAELYAPAGVYRITSKVLFRGIHGLIFRGDGYQTIFRYTGTAPLDYMFEIDGALWCHFRDFTLDQTGTGSVSKMVWLHWGEDTLRSTSGVCFLNIKILGSKFVTGFGVGEGEVQCDNCEWRNCLVNGTTHTDPDYCQNGWEFGDGTSGNNIDHYLYNCSWVLVRYGIRAKSVNFYLFGAQPSTTEIDFYISGTSEAILISGVRSEIAKRFLYSTGGSANQQLAIRDCSYHGGALHADGLGILFAGGGGFQISGLIVHGETVGTFKMAIYMPGGGFPVCAEISGMSSRTAIDSLLHVIGDALDTTVIFTGYTEINVSDQPVTVTPFAYAKNSAIVLRAKPDGSLMSAVKTVATLPAANISEGARFAVSDSSVDTWGSNVAGGGALRVEVRSNGTNWTVSGK